MKTKVLMLGWEFPPHLSGGLGVACFGLVKAMAPQVDLSLILPTAIPKSTLESVHFLNTRQAAKNTGQPTLNPYLDANHPPPPGQDNFALYGPDLTQQVADYTEAALKIAQTQDFDLIHAHDWLTFPAALAIKKHSGKPLVIHIHSLTHDRSGPDSCGPIFEIEKRALALADLVIPVSRYTGRLCLGPYQTPLHKIFPIHNGIDPLQSHPSKKISPHRNILFIGRMVHQKAPLNFLEIAARVRTRHPDARFIMIGDGHLLPEVIAHAELLHLQHHLTCTGFLDRPAINHFLENSDIYCMPSASEPFGLSALEAAQFSIPIVASRQSGFIEVIPSTLSADHSDLDGLARHISHLLDNETLRKKTARLVKKEAGACTWKSTANRVLQLYQDQLGLGHPTS